MKSFRVFIQYRYHFRQIIIFILLVDVWGASIINNTGLGLQEKVGCGYSGSHG